MSLRLSSISYSYLLVEICWSSESAAAVTDAGLTATDWDAVVLGLFKPACVLPIRVVVDAAAVELTEEYRGMVMEKNLQSGVMSKYLKFQSLCKI